MKVKVHPHRPLVKANEKKCVSITPTKRYGRAYYMGSALLMDVKFVINNSGLERARAEGRRNVHAWAVGELLSQDEEQYSFESMFTRARPPVMVEVTYHYETGRMLTVERNVNKVVDVTDGNFLVAYFCGGKFYVSKDWA